MKLENLPDFAKPYKKTGYDVRKSGDAYRLIRITSKRVPGKNYPVLVQEYIGTILEDGSLQRKATKDVPSGIYQEFGLSDFLMQRHKRTLLRSIYGYKNDEFAIPLLMLGIVLYVFGTISKTAIAHCRLTAGREFKSLTKTQYKKVEQLRAKIEQEQLTLFGEDRADFELLMRLCVVDVLSKTTPQYPPEALKILQLHEKKQ